MDFEKAILTVFDLTERNLTILPLHVRLQCSEFHVKEAVMRNRQGCLAGLLELFFLDRAFGWLERRFGFGRGCSCGGCG